MKRVLLILFALLCICQTAFAASIDLSNMTIEELGALKKDVDAELDKRLKEIKPDSYNGLLEGGRSIDAGTYSFTCVGDVRVSVWLYEYDYLMHGEPTNRFECGDCPADRVNKNRSPAKSQH